MNCFVCKTGSYKKGLTTVVLTREETVVIIKDVPAQICDQCGEYILSEEVTKKVMDMAGQARKNGSEVEIRRYAA